MRAVGVPEFGGPEVLEVVDIPVPDPGPGEVRVRVVAATVNPTDLGMRGGARAPMFAAFTPPHVPGMELAGVVDAVGDGVEWVVGDEVMGITVPQRTGRGAQAEFCVVPATSLARRPANISLIEAATVPMNGLTVRRAFDIMNAAAGDTLLVTGGAGAIGGYAIEFGAVAGLTVIAVAALDDEALLRSFGATHVVERGDGLAERVRAIVPDGVDFAIDAALVGPPVLGAIRDDGTLIVVRPFAGESARGITVTAVSVSEYAENAAALDDLRQRVEAGTLTTRVAETIPPERAAYAHERLAVGGVRGRIVITF